MIKGVSKVWVTNIHLAFPELLLRDVRDASLFYLVTRVFLNGWMMARNMRIRSIFFQETIVFFLFLKVCLMVI